MKVTALVERNDNNYYTITAENAVAGCYFGGYGYSVAEAKADFMQSISEMLALAAEEGKNVPDKNEIVVEYRYDIPSFFNAFDWINISAFAKRAGINESKMRAYKSGLSSASEKTIKKILTAVHSLGAELNATTL